MNKYRYINRLLVIFILVAMLLMTSACGKTTSGSTSMPDQTEVPTIIPEATNTPEPTASPASPTNTPEPTSCEEVEGNCFMLTFDGENCIYQGPEIQEEGPVTLLFINNGDWSARVNLMRHQGDETIQDMIDYLGEEPSTIHTPPWAAALGPWEPVHSGERHTSEEILKPGIHTMVCADSRYGWWLGGGFSVGE